MTRCKAGPRAAGLTALLVALVWTLEIAWVQEHTLDLRVLDDHVLWAAKHCLRWGLALCATLSLICFAPRPALVVLLLLHAFFSLTLLTYYEYFGQALSEQVLFTQAGEGASFLTYIPRIVSGTHLGALLAGLLLKLLLLARLPSGRARRPGLLSLGGFVLLTALSLFTLPPLNCVATWGGWQFYAETWGYLPSWGISAYYNASPKTVLNDAVAQSRPVSGSRITDRDKVPFTASNILIVQMESVDFSLLAVTAPDGRPAMPFLNELAHRSFFYEMEPVRSFGTATADFTMLTGMNPGGSRIPYKIDGFPFTSLRGLARAAAEKGFTTGAFHGNFGYFYNRAEPFRASGFTRVHFMEDLPEEALPRCNGYIPDGELFAFALEQMRPGRSLHFIITVTSHGPFDLTPPYPDQPFDRPSSEYQRYINAVRYLDASLARYVESLPEDSLVILYGDHASWAVYPEKRRETVPGLVYMTGRNLAPLQTSSRPDQSRPDQSRPDQSRPDQPRPDQSRAGETDPVPFPELVHFVYAYLEEQAPEIVAGGGER